MATVSQILERNPHREAFDSIIQYLNNSNNPFENALVANLLYNRLSNWGAGTLPLEPPPLLGAPEGYGASIANTNFQENPHVGAYVIRQAGINRTLKDPLTSPIVSFRNYLDGINTSIANAWADFNIAVDVFYEVIDPFSYFATVYKSGLEKTLFLDVLGLYERPGVIGNGVQVNTVKDGVNGIDSRGASTSIYCDVIKDGVEGSYFTHVNDTVGNAIRYIVWLSIDGKGIAPSLSPISGITNSLIQVDLSTIFTADQVRDAILKEVESLIGVTVNVDKAKPIITLTNTFKGSVEESIFSLPALETWDGIFTQGTDTIAGTPELVEIHYGGVIASKLGGRYFQLSNDPNSKFKTVTAFYYNVDGLDSAPKELSGVTNYVEIPIKSTDTIETVQELTDEAVQKAVAFAGWTLVQRKNYCSLFAIGGTAPQPDNGTVALYSGAVTSMKSVTNSSTIGTVNAEDFEQWANMNNTLRAVYDSAFDDGFYLTSLGGVSKHFKIAKSGALQNVYRFFPSNIEVSSMTYNTPGIQWNNKYVAKARNKSF